MMSIAYIGEVARACLNSHDQGVVDSVFERSAYIVFNDIYLCIALSSVGRGPLNIVYARNVQALHSVLRPALPIRFYHADQTLRINDVVLARIAHACICDSTAKPMQLDTDTLSAHRRCLARMPIPTRGLFPLIATTSSSNQANNSFNCIDSRLPADATLDLALTQFVLPCLRNLICWLGSVTCTGTAILEPPKSICSLLGAGPGLTPSGDDLLAGVLLTLQITGYTHASEMLWAHLRPAVADRTNRISGTLLQQAAQNRAGEFALSALAMYASQGTLDTVKLSNVISRIGDTSGWDFLAGVVLVLDAVAASEADNRKMVDRQLASG